jgi:uncharacterized protein (UPF0548 family)
MRNRDPGYGAGMAQGLTLRRRAATAARWPVGVLLTSWRYMWRTTPMTRLELRGEAGEDSPPPLPDDVEGDGFQVPADGAGPLFHRRYVVRILEPELSAEEIVSRLAADPDLFAPSEFASFQRVDGEDRPMSVGDDYVVRMPGPWDGPVRVVELTPTSFRLATLEGHLEAGQIEFRAADEGDVVFTIESWARSGDRLSNVLYDRMRMAKEIQLHMWTSVLERVTEHSGGRRAGRIEIETRRVEEGDSRLLGSGRKRRALILLSELSPNFEPPEHRDPADGWHLDDQREQLETEEPGPPEPAGSWEIAQRLMRGYEFADPSIVRAYYDPRSPLEGRDMLLEIRFLGLRFLAGVRINQVYDRTELEDGREARVWGWSYVTLEGHLEQGEMHWEVRKSTETGEVEFALRAQSRRARDPNPLVRIGFRLVGRREQLRFYDSTCERMRRLTAEALGPGPRGAAVRAVAQEVTVRRVRADDAAHGELARNVDDPAA